MYRKLLLNNMDSRQLHFPAWFIFAALTLAVRFEVLSCSVIALGNHLICYREACISSLLSALIFSLLLDFCSINVYYPVLFTTVPIIVFLNKNPIVALAKLLGGVVSKNLIFRFLVITLMYIIISTAIVYLL